MHGGITLKKILILIIILLVMSMLSTACIEIPSISDEQTGSTIDSKIKMPHASSYYIDAKWTVETLIDHLTSLGFNNVRTIACTPNDSNYKLNIFDIHIAVGWFKTEPWEAGETFNADAEISIFYNEFPLLTVENCPDLITMLTSKNLDYMTFANKYNGRYIEFDAFVYSHHTYNAGIDHIIDITGGDYDGSSGLGHFDGSGSTGVLIRVGDRIHGNQIDESVEEGQNITVSGKVDASWSKYYKQLYIECIFLLKRE